MYVVLCTLGGMWQHTSTSTHSGNADQKNEVNEKLKDLAKTYNLPKTKVLTILISDAHSKYIEGNPEWVK